jgi:hypothetical protein
MAEAGPGDEERYQAFQCCVAISPSAQRGVAGGRGLGDSGAAVDRDEYLVHVCIRRGATVCSSATAGTCEYTTLALVAQ